MDLTLIAALSADWRRQKAIIEHHAGAPLPDELDDFDEIAVDEPSGKLVFFVESCRWVLEPDEQFAFFWNTDPDRLEIWRNGKRTVPPNR